MTLVHLSKLVLAMTMGLALTAPHLVFSASSTTTLLEARRDAEARGYVFLTSREEIIAKAKNEGKLRLTSSFDAETLRDLTGAFKKKHAFIDIQPREVGGTETYVRMME